MLPLSPHRGPCPVLPNSPRLPVHGLTQLALSSASGQQGWGFVWPREQEGLRSGKGKARHGQDLLSGLETGWPLIPPDPVPIPTSLGWSSRGWLQFLPPNRPSGSPRPAPKSQAQCQSSCSSCCLLTRLTTPPPPNSKMKLLSPSHPHTKCRLKTAKCGASLIGHFGLESPLAWLKLPCDCAVA